jgi:hypothetical protein
MSFFERAINLLPDLKLHQFLENGPGKRERMKRPRVTIEDELQTIESKIRRDLG